MSGAMAALLILGAAAGAAPVERLGARAPVPVLCYVETVFGGAGPEALDLSPCTHVIEAFLLPEPTGALRPANGLPRRALVERARRAGQRVLVSIGGATVPGATFAALVRQPEALSRFADAVARFVAEAGYDGVDLDWEFPTSSERGLQVALVRAVRARLEATFAARRRRERPLVLLGVTTGAHLCGYDFPALAPHVDGFVQFGYDFRNPALGPWANGASFWPDEATRPIEASVRGVAAEVLRRGAPREKLIIALPLYAGDGRPWVEIRERVLAAARPAHPLYLERPWDGTWVTDPPALEAKVRRIVAGTEIAGGAAAGVALWQLGHQGASRELTEAVRRGLER